MALIYMEVTSLGNIKEKREKKKEDDYAAPRPISKVRSAESLVERIAGNAF